MEEQMEINWDNNDIIRYKTLWLMNNSQHMSDQLLAYIKSLESFLVHMPQSLTALRGTIKEVLQDMDVAVEGLQEVNKLAGWEYYHAQEQYAARAKQGSKDGAETNAG